MRALLNAPTTILDNQTVVVAQAAHVDLLTRFSVEYNMGHRMRDGGRTRTVEINVHVADGMVGIRKLFNTVQAGVRGTITEVCVPDGEFIEYGTAIFRVRPH